MRLAFVARVAWGLRAAAAVVALASFVLAEPCRAWEAHDQGRDSDSASGWDRLSRFRRESDEPPRRTPRESDESLRRNQSGGIVPDVESQHFLGGVGN